MKNNKLNIFKGIKNCLNLIYHFDKKYLFLSIVMATIQGTLPSISLLISQRIINSMQVSSKSMEEILFLLGMYIIITISPSILLSYYGFYKIQFNKNFGKHIEILLLEKVSKLKLQDFENDDTYDMINRAQSQKGLNITMLSDNIISVIRDSISIISLIAVLSQFKIWLIIIVVVLPTLNSIYSVKLGKEQYDVNVNRTWKDRKAWYIDYLLSKGYAYKELVIFDLKNKLLDEFKSLKEDMISQDMKIEKKYFFANIIYILLDSILSSGIMVFILFQGFLKRILIGDVTTYIQAVQSIKDNIESLFSLFNTIIHDLFYTDFLFEFLEYDCKDSAIKNEHISNEIETIEIVNLSYKYPNTSNYALKNINLTLEKNNPIAILGKNGSGKTTLLKILLGFYDDYEGEILINGKELRNIKEQEYINRVSCMFQDYIKYEASIRENVGMRESYEKDIDNKIKFILQETNLNKKIYEEEGLDTILGNWFGKKQLSMGEWQRIAISRALLKNADLYIFDEPDSSLDAEAENGLLSLYRKTFEGKFGIFITHNIPHVKKVTNNIIVLENGEISESGDHNELISKEGVYFNLFYSCE